MPLSLSVDVVVVVVVIPRQSFAKSSLASSSPEFDDAHLVLSKNALSLPSGPLKLICLWCASNAL